MGRLDGKVAVVTGGANGIGRACADLFAVNGAAVVVADVLGTAAAETAASIMDQGGRAVHIEADATSPGDSSGIMALAIEAFGGLDIAVTAAGISHAGYRSGDLDAERTMISEAGGRSGRSRRFLETPLAEWQRVLDVNLTGTFLAVQAAARLMLQHSRRGSIITLASIAAKHPDAGRLAYGVSKAGVWMLTKHAASVLAPHGIRVNAIGPGLIETNMLAVVDEVPGLKEEMLKDVPMRRFGTPMEVANAALFLASDEASYFTGEMLHPSGGYYTG